MIDNKKEKGINVKGIKVRDITRGNKAVLTIKEYSAPSVLGDENRFFKRTYEQEKKNLFLS